MNERLRDLMAKRKKAVEEARAINDKVTGEKREMTKEEAASYDKAFEEQVRLKAEIVREERAIELKREEADLELRNKEFETGREKGKPVDPQELQMRGFRGFLRHDKGYSGEGAKEFRALQADSDTAGGYSVPQQFSTELIKALDSQIFIRNLATKYQVTVGDSLGLLSLDSDPEDGDWSGEITEFDEDTQMAMGKREMNPTLLKKLIKVSEKLVRKSALNIDMLVRDRFTYKFGITQEKAYLTGTGANQPLGIFTASANGIPTSQDVSTDNEATKVTVDGLKNAKFGIRAPYRSRAQWVFHSDGIKMVSKLKDAEGRYLWQDAIREGEPDMLLGRPVNESEYAPNTFTSGLYVGAFGDFSFYGVADSLALRIKVLLEKYAGTGQIGYIADYEGDGMPLLGEAFARVKLG